MSNIKFTVRDKLNRYITLTEERWKHIQKGHTEITSTSMVRNAIMQADVIVEDIEFNNVDFYFRFDPSIPGKQIRVVTVIDIEENTGNVITAHPDSGTCAVTLPGRIKWQK